MRRAAFVKSVLSLTGTAFVYGCKGINGLDPLLLHDDSSDISLQDSQEWFVKEYLPIYASTSARGNGNLLRRSLDWSKSGKVKIKKNEFVWVPIIYDNVNQLPTLITWKDGQEYIPKLAEYLKWSIAEGFMVYRGKDGAMNGFMVQVAYDPFKHKPGTVIDPAHFTGMLIHAAWDESPVRVWRYLDGELESSFDKDMSQNGRQRQCYPIYYKYQTVTGHSCGQNCTEVTVTLHTASYTYCDNGSGGGGGSGSGSGSGAQGYPYYSGGGSSGPNPTPPTSVVYNQYVHYDYGKVARYISPDYQIFMQRFNTAITAMNITATTFGLSSTYADVMIKTLGMEDASVIRTSTIVSSVSRVIGIAGIALSGYQVVIGFSDGDISQADMLNAAGLVLAGVSVFTPIGWVAISAGVMSAAIGFYTTANP